MYYTAPLTSPGIGIPPPLSLSTVPPPPFFTSRHGGIPSSMPGYHRPRPFTAMAPRPPSWLSDTLILRKVPRELNTVTKLSAHFEKFGSIVNLTVSQGS